MIVTIELLLADDDADSIANALDAISNQLSDVGYDDSEFASVSPGDQVKALQYRVIRGTHTGR
jgi:hypothetical protein